jgi:hypothetical protein
MAKKPSVERSPLRAPLMWIDFPWLADEWFVVYAYSHRSLTSVTMFALAHSVELYLKGCVAKHEFLVATNIRGMTDAERTKCEEDSVKKAVDYNHRLFDIWKALKAADPSFMPGFDLLDSVLSVAFTDDEEELHSKLPSIASSNYREHRELYLVMRYIADLKYLGGPMKKEMHPYFSHDLRSDYWIKFFTSIRKWIWEGQAHYTDRMSILVHDADRSGMPPEVVEYLNRLGLKQYTTIETEFKDLLEKVFWESQIDDQGSTEPI